MIPLKKRYRLPRALMPGKYILLAVAIASLSMEYRFFSYRLYLEPYGYLFSRQTVWWLYLLPILMLAIGLFIPRFWCRGFCPMGAALRSANGLRRWILKGRSPKLSLPPASAGWALWMASVPFGIILVSNILIVVLL